MEPLRDVERLSAFAVAGHTFPDDVLSAGRRTIVDQLGCQIAGATMPWSRSYRDAILHLGAGTGAHVVYDGDMLAVDQAAFLNSAYGHAVEYDDTHLAAMTHSGSVIVPAVLALAEQRGRSGAEALAAAIVGVEVMLRIAWAGAPHIHERGHNAQVAAGPFGAAAACSRLLGLGADRCLHALAVAGSHAGGLLEYTVGGGSVKRIHSAIGAMNGLRSAVMAEHGITGPAGVLEGERGFLRSFAGTYDASRLATGLGTEFQLRGVSFKPIAANFSTHAALEALGGLVREHGLGAERIAAVEIGAARSTLGAVGVERPHDVLGAQGSMIFSAVVLLMRGGNRLDDYREEQLTDLRFLALAQRIHTYVDEECDEEQRRLRNRAAIVTVTTTDGRRLQRRVRSSKGTPENPLSDAELGEKFLASAAPRIGAERAAELLDRLWRIEELADVGELLALTRPLARS